MVRAQNPPECAIFWHNSGIQTEIQPWVAGIMLPSGHTQIVDVKNGCDGNDLLHLYYAFDLDWVCASRPRTVQ